MQILSTCVCLNYSKPMNKNYYNRVFRQDKNLESYLVYEII